MSKRDAQIDQLAGVALFRGCSKAELRKLAGITTEMTARTGEVLCREGSAGSSCYVIIEGEAEVTIAAAAIDTIGPGGFFGEMALLDGGPRVATVTATTDMRLLVMSRGEFTSLLADVPSVSRKMLEALGHRLRLAREQAHDASIGI
ncbi:MAG: cyclic nucleotide-binding domain-containing protein [Ilumatobacteraceae bacterium]